MGVAISREACVCVRSESDSDIRTPLVVAVVLVGCVSLVWAMCVWVGASYVWVGSELRLTALLMARQ